MIARMSNLIVIGFNHAADAFEMRAALAKLQTQYLIEMEDAVVVTRDAKGKVQLHQPVSLTAAGAAGGMLGMNEALRQLTGKPLGAPVPNARTGVISCFGTVNYDRGVCSSAAILQRGRAA